jgi:hypothetical protein
MQDKSLHLPKGTEPLAERLWKYLLPVELALTVTDISLAAALYLVATEEHKQDFSDIIQERKSFLLLDGSILHFDQKWWRNSSRKENYIWWEKP